MASTVEQVKARLTIVEVVSGYLKLERAGVNHRARCPFHQEKTPSFFVSPSRGTYHCFGCNRGGDLISFVQEIENLDFVSALRMLAERAGVEYRRPNPELSNLKDRLYQLHEAASRYYSEQLAAAPAALAYLKKRGLTEETIKSFRLGLAPDGWQNIAAVLTRQGFSEAELNQAGLLVRPPPAPGRSGSAYDRFRGRLMFPLADTVGRIVGFSGRIFQSETEPKYINSPATTVYDKSKLLYLYDRARLPMRQTDRCILVEGQMDALLSHQAGFPETVAVSGTALTADHLELIKRLTNNLIMAFDADLAGVAASRRAIVLALGLGFEVKILVLPTGADPADLIRDEPDKWRQAASGAVHLIDFLLLVLDRQKLDRRSLAHAIEREVYPFIAELVSPLDQAFFINKVAILLGLPENVIQAGVAASRSPISPEPSQSSIGKDKPKLLTRRERLAEIIGGLIFWRGDLAGPAAERLGERQFAELGRTLEPRRQELAFAAELAYGQSARLAEEFSDLLDHWQEEIWRAELSELLTRIKQSAGAPAGAITPLLNRCQFLSRQINHLKKYAPEESKQKKGETVA